MIKAILFQTLLDFDYGESDEEEERKTQPTDMETDQDGSLPPNVQNILNDPSIMQHIQKMSQTIKRTEQLKSELSIQEERQRMQEERQRMLQQQHDEFNQQIQTQPPLPPQMEPHSLLAQVILNVYQSHLTHII